MRLALLGYDDDALALVDWACSEGGHTLAAAYETGPGLSRRLAATPEAGQTSDAWESLLVRNDLDLIVVGLNFDRSLLIDGASAVERREDQLRKLAAAGTPLVVVHPACEAMVGYEVEMVRREARTTMLPWAPGALHPAWGELAEWLRMGSGPLGVIERMEWVCAAEDRSRPAVLRRLVRDALAIRALVGGVRQVSASGPALAEKFDPLSPAPKPHSDLSNLQVLLRGEAATALSWKMGPVLSGAGAELTLIGTLGKAVLQMPAGEPWTLAGDGNVPVFQRYDDFCEPRAVLEAVAVLAGERSGNSPWLAACRDLELPGVVERSLLRGRTLDLAADEPTEQQNFKGVMAAGGCLALVAALGVIGLGFVLDGMPLPFEHKYLRYLLPSALVGGLILFLASQLLGVLAKDRRQSDQPEAPDRPTLPVK